MAITEMSITPNAHGPAACIFVKGSDSAVNEKLENSATGSPPALKTPMVEQSDTTERMITISRYKVCSLCIIAMDCKDS